MDLRKELNESQLEAVEYIDGPSLVIAGAGSGKTRVLTYKIAYLLEHGYKPWEILALTFTNKAAREMKERIATLVSIREAESLWMGTFHSLFNRMLRKEADRLGLMPNYSIYQPSDSKSLIKTLLKERNLDEKVYKPSTILGRISEAKNALILPKQYCGDATVSRRDSNDNMPRIGELYTKYMERMRQANAMDFDDLLLFTYILFDRYPDVRHDYASRFKYILVDEYQDTNFAQHQILRQLSEENNHVCVVGDDAQSIYSFRGAKIDNILKFSEQYPGTKLFKLEQNYRSTQTIVQAANSVIAHNRRQIPKTVYSRNDVGTPLSLKVAYSDVEEGEMVCNKILRIHQTQHLPYSQIAILYRTNAQSRVFEEGLRGKGIPYKIYGGRSFYDHKTVRDVFAYFRLIVNPDDEEALKRIINYPTRGIGDTTLGKLMHAASEHGIGVWTVLNNLALYAVPISPATSRKVSGFVDMVNEFIQHNAEMDVSQLGTEVIKRAGILAEACKTNDVENVEMREILSELQNGMKSFVDRQMESGNVEMIHLIDYLNEVSLLSEQDVADAEDTDQDEKVTLMTVHSAKGLEFDTVFIVGMEQDLFPNAMASFSERELEEERRLFYVAITRAMNNLYLSCAKSRFRYGKMEMSNPSSFLKEIDRDCIRLMVGNTKPSYEARRPEFNPAPRVPTRLERVQVSSSSRPSRQSLTVRGMSLHVGGKVLHERFGEGTILSIEGEGDNASAKVRFAESGEKLLLLKYAKIQVL